MSSRGFLNEMGLGRRGASRSAGLIWACKRGCYVLLFVVLC